MDLTKVTSIAHFSLCNSALANAFDGHSTCMGTNVILSIPLCISYSSVTVWTEISYCMPDH